MHSAKISASSSYLAFIQPDSNELNVMIISLLSYKQIWDIRGKAKCLQRIKPVKGKDTPNQKQSS